MPHKLTLPPQLEFQDEATLFSLSFEFIEAAKVLYSTPPMRCGYNLVAYYLAGHAAELMLKSFLFQSGDSINDLSKRYRHDLKLLLKRARSKGLPVALSTEYIQYFAGAYTRKRTEYRTKRPLRLPPLDLLLEEIERLKSHVFAQITLRTSFSNTVAEN